MPENWDRFEYVWQFLFFAINSIQLLRFCTTDKNNSNPVSLDLIWSVFAESFGRNRVNAIQFKAKRNYTTIWNDESSIKTQSFEIRVIWLEINNQEMDISISMITAVNCTVAERKKTRWSLISPWSVFGFPCVWFTHEWLASRMIWYFVLSIVRFRFYTAFVYHICKTCDHICSFVCRLPAQTERSSVGFV